MTISTSFLNALAHVDDGQDRTLNVIWPMPGNPCAILTFTDFKSWQAFVLDLSSRRTLPDPVAGKFERCQKLLLLSWIDGELIFAAELIAWTALELALTDRYGANVRRKNGSIHFADLLKYIVAQDGLTDEVIPLNQRCGEGKIVGFLTGDHKPSLARRRNDMSHGGFLGTSSSPCPGLIEVVRDLMDYAYRDWPPLCMKFE